jgi:UDP-N-acetylglucosamine acyltransferase
MIHPSSIVSSSSILGTNVAIGAYTIVEDNVSIGDNTIIEPHVIVRSGTKIGNNNHIYQFSSIGESSQDKEYTGEASYLLIGDNNIIRESCVIHRGTSKDHNTTKIGNDNLIMSHCHVAHDCVLGNNITMASYSALAGHVHIYDKAILGGATLIHQYCHIGSYSMSAINTVILKDVPAYLMVGGNVARERGMNCEGMRRLGYTQEQISSLRNAYRIVYRNSYTISEALEKIDLLAQDDANIKIFAQSISNSKRGITR